MINTKSIVAIAALLVGTLAFSGSAEADHWHHHGGGGVAAGGLVGFAAGAMVGSALAQPRVVVVDEGYRGYPNWVSYCMSRYRSFDPRTGLYFGHDGYSHECR